MVTSFLLVLLAAGWARKPAFAQAPVLSGYYIDTWMGLAGRHDTGRFAFYPNWTPRITDERDYVEIDSYRDSARKVVLESVVANKYPWTVTSQSGSRLAVDYDSFRYVYQYDARGNSRCLAYERAAFKQSGGCFRYENRYAGSWHLIVTTDYVNDVRGNCVRETRVYHSEGPSDTVVLNTVYRYDPADRVVSKSVIERGKLKAAYTSVYLDGYTKTEEYNAERKLVQRTEQFFSGPNLQRETIYRNNHKAGTLQTKIYSYDASGRRDAIRTYQENGSGELTMVRSREYFYDSESRH